MSVSTEKQRFTIRASRSRLEKGLLALPQKFKDRFSREKGQIQVVFDDEDKAKALTFHPYDPTVKESRIFGLGRWFSRRGVREGDLISITLEDLDRRVYRIALDRFVREREEQRARQKLHAARTDTEATQELNTLSRLTRKRGRRLAQEELLRIARESVRRPRPRVVSPCSRAPRGCTFGNSRPASRAARGEMSALLVHFEKRNGEPYFEIHHLDPEIGHHPSNLLLVCPNCHAQLEHAIITDFKWADSWLVGLTVNAKRVAVRQPLADDSITRSLLSLGVVVAVIQIGRVLLR